MLYIDICTREMIIRLGIVTHMVNTMRSISINTIWHKDIWRPSAKCQFRCYFLFLLAINDYEYVKALQTIFFKILVKICQGLTCFHFLKDEILPQDEDVTGSLSQTTPNWYWIGAIKYEGPVIAVLNINVNGTGWEEVPWNMSVRCRHTFYVQCEQLERL